MATLKNGNVTVSFGNAKLDKGILIFNLPAISTCPNCSQCASTCYARKAEKLYPTVLPCRKRNHLASLNSTFVARMVELIERSKVNVVRVHESGDFYSPEYAAKWEEIAKRCPSVKFYCYTKAPWFPKVENFNVVTSWLPNGDGTYHVNYGPKAVTFALAKKHRAKVCPYGLAKKHFTCGTECKACQKHPKVVFVQH